MNRLIERRLAAANVDLVRAMPRHVEGFSLELETAMMLGELAASLNELAATSAFVVHSLHERGPAPTGVGRTVRVEFALAAPRGAAGDAQIVALVRAIAGRHRWNRLEKRLAR